jgi:hypothetical protein
MARLMHVLLLVLAVRYADSSAPVNRVSRPAPPPEISPPSALRPLLNGVVNAVRGDRDVGENSAMYTLMGYVPKSRRRKPGRNKKASPRSRRAAE